MCPRCRDKRTVNGPGEVGVGLLIILVSICFGLDIIRCAFKGDYGAARHGGPVGVLIMGGVIGGTLLRAGIRKPCPVCRPEKRASEPGEPPVHGAARLPHQACGNCGYDLFGLKTNQRCPECGYPVTGPPVRKTLFVPILIVNGVGVGVALLFVVAGLWYGWLVGLGTSIILSVGVVLVSRLQR